MLPEKLTISAVTASCLEVGAELTAQDLAVMLTVIWYAAQQQRQADAVHVDIPEKTLRDDLFGPGKTADLKREADRLDRLSATVLYFDERLPAVQNGVRAPTIDPDLRRTRISGSKRWTIDPDLIAAFSVYPDDEVIQLPVELLRRARCRFSTLLYLRVASWIEGELERKWIRTATADKLMLRVPLQSVREAVGYEGEPADMARYVLEPATREINLLTDRHVDATLVRAPGRGLGKVLAIDFLIGRPVLVTPKARVRKPKVEVLPPNVVRLQPPRRITRGTVPARDEPVEY